MTEVLALTPDFSASDDFNTLISLYFLPSFVVIVWGLWSVVSYLVVNGEFGVSITVLATSLPDSVVPEIGRPNLSL